MKRSQVRMAALAVLLLALGVSKMEGQGAPSSTPASGERLEVADLEIEGVRAVDESELRAALQTRPSSWWPWGDKGYFNRETSEADVKRIEEFYRERGYPNARVVDSDVQRRDGEVAVRIVVEEGTPLRVASLEFTGFEAIAPSRLGAIRELAPLKPGDPLATEALRQTAQMAADALGEAGYAYTRVGIASHPGRTGTRGGGAAR